MEYLILLVLILNTLWFGMGFRFFSLKSKFASKLLLKQSNRIEPFFSIMTQSMKFLGAMNFAFAILSLFSIFNYELLMDSHFGAAVILVFAIAHGGQFWANLPQAKVEYKGGQPLWSVLTGRMRFIFITDLILASANLILGLYLWFYN